MLFSLLGRPSPPFHLLIHPQPVTLSEKQGEDRGNRSALLRKLPGFPALGQLSYHDFRSSRASSVLGPSGLF